MGHCSVKVLNSFFRYEFHALDFNFYSAEVIFSDVKSKVPTIRRANMNIKQNNSVIVYGPGKVEGIASLYDLTRFLKSLFSQFKDI